MIPSEDAPSCLSINSVFILLIIRFWEDEIKIFNECKNKNIIISLYQDLANSLQDNKNYGDLTWAPGIPNSLFEEVK